MKKINKKYYFVQSNRGENKTAAHIYYDEEYDGWLVRIGGVDPFYNILPPFEFNNSYVLVCGRLADKYELLHKTPESAFKCIVEYYEETEKRKEILENEKNKELKNGT